MRKTETSKFHEIVIFGPVGPLIYCFKYTKILLQYKKLDGNNLKHIVYKYRNLENPQKCRCWKDGGRQMMKIRLKHIETS